MMRYDTFPRSVVFGALAALGWVPWVMFVAPLLGVWEARTLYLVGALTLYVSGLAPARVDRLRISVVAALAAGCVALVAGSTTTLVIGLAIVLGAVRSGFLYSAVPPRAFVREAILVVGGLLLVRFLLSGPLASTGLALWGFVLVQSFFFLLPRDACISKLAHDPFEEAHRRALALLERSGI